MKPVTIIYWTRVLLGVITALISTFLGAISSEIHFGLLNGLTVALAVYIITYYIYKPLFINKVEKRSKILTTGIGTYFLTWIVAWAAFYTLLTPPST
jgi:hypothetical protein